MQLYIRVWGALCFLSTELGILLDVDWSLFAMNSFRIGTRARTTSLVLILHTKATTTFGT